MLGRFRERARFGLLEFGLGLGGGDLDFGSFDLLVEGGLETCEPVLALCWSVAEPFWKS